jgi:hypothetical protein
MTTKSVWKRRSTAAHEAGHALVAIRHGIDIHLARITPDGPRVRGEVLVAREPVTYSAMITVYMAGAIAEDLVRADDRFEISVGIADDMRKARELCRSLRLDVMRGEPADLPLAARPTVRQVAAAGWAEAHRILTEDFGALIALADALDQSTGPVPGDTLQAIVGNTDRTPAPPQATAWAEDFWQPWFADETRFWRPTPRTKAKARRKTAAKAA